MKQVKFIRGKWEQYMWIDTQVNSERESCPRGSLNQLYQGISFRFPLCNHFDWPDSESVFGISQDPSMCVGTCLSLTGFYQRDLWVGLTLLPFWTPRSFLLGKSSFLRFQKWRICGIFYPGTTKPLLLIVLLWKEPLTGVQCSQVSILYCEETSPVCSLYRHEVKWKRKSLSRAWVFVTPWTIQSMELFRSEYWSWQPFPSPVDLPNPGIELHIST